MEQGDEDEWKGWKERERVDHFRKLVMIASAALSTYPLSKLWDAISLGEVEKFRARGSPRIYRLSSDADAYYINTVLWAGATALCIWVAIRVWQLRKRGDAGPVV